MKIELLEIINVRKAEDIVFACEKQFLPIELASEPNATKCTVFYYPERDALVLNKNNPDYLIYKRLLIDYMNLNNYSRKELCEISDSMGITFFRFINRILRIQRKRRKNHDRHPHIT